MVVYKFTGVGKNGSQEDMLEFFNNQEELQPIDNQDKEQVKMEEGKRKITPYFLHVCKGEENSHLIKIMCWSKRR